MRIHTTLVLLGAAALSLPAFAESSAPSADAAGTASTPPSLSAEQRDALQGHYELSDGRVLRVYSARRKLYAELDGKRTELVPVAPNRFAARDDAMRLQFDGIPFATQVRLDMRAN